MVVDLFRCYFRSTDIQARSCSCDWIEAYVSTLERTYLLYLRSEIIITIIWLACFVVGLRWLCLFRQFLFIRSQVNWRFVLEVHIAEITITTIGSWARCDVELVGPLRTLLKSVQNVLFRGAHSWNYLLRKCNSGFSKRFRIFTRAWQPFSLVDKSLGISDFRRFWIAIESFNILWLLTQALN